jgi:cytochrome P450
MTLHPEIARKAQKELDQVLGDRLPDFSDKPTLPYVCALVHEVARWNPVAPLAVPRRLVADDVYQGMFMPAGSLVLANTWYGRTTMSCDLVSHLIIGQCSMTRMCTMTHLHSSPSAF